MGRSVSNRLGYVVCGHYQVSGSSLESLEFQVECQKRIPADQKSQSHDGERRVAFLGRWRKRRVVLLIKRGELSWHSMTPKSKELLLA